MRVRVRVEDADEGGGGEHEHREMMMKVRVGGRIESHTPKARVIVRATAFDGP